MLEIHRKLDERYHKLKDSRKSPIYFIEHGLSQREVDHVVEEIRLLLNSYPIECKWWDANYLPLIVAATEVGYRYRGNGTDFWPNIEDRFGVPVNVNDRHRIRRHFHKASSIYRGAQPPDTPWARAFCIIVWPITHALLPIEFHRQLAIVLKNLRNNVSELDDKELHDAIRIAATECSTRFMTMIEDASLVVTMTRRLLGDVRIELSSEVLERISEDIASDQTTKRAVSIARRIQLRRGSGPSPPSSPRASHPPLTGSLSLHRRNGSMTLEVCFPTIESNLHTKLLQMLRRRRYSARLWGVSTPITCVQLLSSLPFRLNLTSLPPEGAKLLPDIDQIDVEPRLRGIMNTFELNAMPPLLFAISSDGTHGRQIRGSDISGYRKYWLLTDVGERPRGGVDMGELGPYRCYQLDPDEEVARESLGKFGFQVRYGILVGFSGSPPLNPIATMPTFAIGDRRFLVPKLVPQNGLCIHFGDEKIQLNDNDIASIDVMRGEQSLCVSNGDIRRDFMFRGSPFLRVAPPIVCSIEQRSVDFTVQALLRGALNFDIESHAPIEGLDLTVEIEISGQRFSVTTPIDPLPCSITTNQEPFNTLLDENIRDLLTKATMPTLRLRVGNLCSFSKALEQRIQPCWWETLSGKYTLTSEIGILPYGWLSATDPAAQPGPIPEIITDEAWLLAPVDPDVTTHGDLAQFTTLCIATNQARIDAPIINRPKLARYHRTGPDGHGLENIVEGYLRWSLAETSDFIAELRRRQVTQILDSWVATVCCSKEWAYRESKLKTIDPWDELFNVINKTGFGRDTYFTTSTEDDVEVSRIAVRQIRSKLPDLWVRVGLNSILNLEDYDTLDLACMHAYSVLSKRYRKQGKEDIAAELEAADPGEARDGWDNVLDRIQKKSELHPLVEMLIPSDMADRLRTLEPSNMSLHELAEELETWVSCARRSYAGEIPSAETLKAILALWIEPEISLSLNWRRALDTLIIDRSVARAARYLALRSRRASKWGDH